MPKITATAILSHVRHLAVVIIFMGTFLVPVAKSWVSVCAADNPSITVKISTKPAFFFKQKDLKERVSVFKAIQQRVSLEAILPFYQLIFPPQITACPISGSAYYFFLQQPGILLYAARAPGVSFVSRIFPFTIQPNAP